MSSSTPFARMVDEISNCLLTMVSSYISTCSSSSAAMATSSSMPPLKVASGGLASSISSRARRNLRARRVAPPSATAGLSAGRMLKVRTSLKSAPVISAKDTRVAISAASSKLVTSGYLRSPRVVITSTALFSKSIVGGLGVTRLPPFAATTEPSAAPVDTTAAVVATVTVVAVVAVAAPAEAAAPPAAAADPDAAAPPALAAVLPAFDAALAACFPHLKKVASLR